MQTVQERAATNAALDMEMTALKTRLASLEAVMTSTNSSGGNENPSMKPPRSHSTASSSSVRFRSENSRPGGRKTISGRGSARRSWHEEDGSDEEESSNYGRRELGRRTSLPRSSRSPARETTVRSHRSPQKSIWRRGEFNEGHGGSGNVRTRDGGRVEGRMEVFGAKNTRSGSGPKALNSSIHAAPALKASAPASPARAPADEQISFVHSTPLTENFGESGESDDDGNESGASDASRKAVRERRRRSTKEKEGGGKGETGEMIEVGRHERIVAVLKGRIGQLEQALESAQAARAADLNGVKPQLQAAVEALAARDEHVAGLRTKLVRVEGERDAALAQLQSVGGNVNEAVARAVRDRDGAHAKELALVKQKMAETVAELKARVEAASHAVDRGGLLREELKLVRAEKDLSEAEVQRLSAENAAMARELRRLDAMIYGKRHVSAAVARTSVSPIRSHRRGGVSPSRRMPLVAPSLLAATYGGGASSSGEE